jgi:DNA-binding transcriptional LysR family regulator
MVDPGQVNIDRFLRTVLAVAEARKITRAAERLRTAQPWVSRQLREVEKEVGVKLFKRVHSGVETTASGEVFVEEVRQAIFHIELSVSRARAASASVLDTLMVGVSPTFDPVLCEQIRNCMSSVLPEIRLSFDSRFVSEQVEGILRTDLHMGLAELPIRSEHIQVLLLKREPMVLAGGRGDPLLAASSLDAGHLNRKPWVILAGSRNPAQKRLMELLLKRGVSQDRIREVLTLPEALHQVVGGKAIAILPSIADKLNYGDVTFRPIKDFQMGYGLIFHEDHRSSAIRTVLSAIQRVFAKDRIVIQPQREGARKRLAELQSAK